MLWAGANKLAASFRDFADFVCPFLRTLEAACHPGIWIFELFRFKKGLGESRRKVPRVLVRDERTRSY